MLLYTNDNHVGQNWASDSNYIIALFIIGPTIISNWHDYNKQHNNTTSQK